MNAPHFPLSGPTPRHGALHEGIPIWLGESIRGWIERALDGLTNYYGDRDTYAALAKTFDLKSRLEDPLAVQIKNTYLWAVVMKRSDELILDFVDFLLPALEGTDVAWEAESLESALDVGGPVWRVAERQGLPGLERRVDDTAMAAGEKAMAESGHSGKLLEQAWQKVYGRNPDPKGAYSKAVLAVEEVAGPLVTPHDKVPSLGKVAGVMRDQGNWRYVLHEGGRESAQDAPLHQIQELWHRDPRHADGTGNYRDPSPQEAETAVLIAVGLVHMFHNRLIAQNP